MASLQAKHVKTCNKQWTTFNAAQDDCSCPRGPTYYVVIREGAKAHKERVGRNRKEAERALRRIESAIDAGAYQHARSVSLGEFAKNWLDGLDIKPTTKETYESSIKHLLAFLGAAVQLRRVNTQHIMRFLVYLRDEKKLSPTTRHKHLTTLSTFFEAAVADGAHSRNPVSDIPKSARPRKSKNEAAYFEDSELVTLLEISRTSATHEFRVVFRLLLFTGMRLGEVLALRWIDIDLVQGDIHVREQIPGGQRVPGTPKSNQKREVDIFPEAAKLLGDVWKSKQPAPTDLVVCTPSGAYLDPQAIRRELYVLMKTGGIPRMGPTRQNRSLHSLRHTFAKKTLEAGASLSWLKRQLGHASISFSDDRYGHWERKARKRHVDSIGDAFSGMDEES